MTARNTARAVVRFQGCPPCVHTPPEAVRILDGGIDTIYFSLDVLVSRATYARLLSEQDDARTARDERRATYVSSWLNAAVSPHGANGYPILIQRADQWAIRVQRNNPHQPGIFVEMRSYALHMHPNGPLGACAEACAFVRDVLLFDDPGVQLGVSLKTAKCSRIDFHLDWQGGWHPTMDGEEIHCFIKPGHTSWNTYMQGNQCLGYSFGKRRIMARIYNKSLQMRQKQQDWYPLYLQAKAGDKFNIKEDVFRLEFEVKREGVNGFNLVTPPEVTDSDATIEAELEGEGLPNIGNVVKAVHWGIHVFAYLTRRWLRLTQPNGDKNKARWPTHPTWEALQQGFAQVYHQRPMCEASAKLVRMHRHSGYGRGLERMALGIMTTAEAMLDADPASVLPGFLAQVKRQAVAARTAQQVKRAKKALGVEEGRRLKYLEQVERLADEALGVFTSLGVARGTLPPCERVADLMEYLCDDLEEIALRKGGVGQLMYDKWCKLYKVMPPKQMISLAA